MRLMSKAGDKVFPNKETKEMCSLKLGHFAKRRALSLEAEVYNGLLLLKTELMECFWQAHNGEPDRRCPSFERGCVSLSSNGGAWSPVLTGLA